MGGAIRMVKLFGWEERMSRNIDDKRRAELNAIWKLKMFNLFNRILTYVPITVTLIHGIQLHSQKHHPYFHDARHLRDIRRWRLVSSPQFITQLPTDTGHERGFDRY